MEKRYLLIILKYCTLLVFIGFCLVPPLYAKDFTGVWSNEEGEFKTFSIGLRVDGRGTLSMAIFPAPLRWEHKDDGIRVRATLDNRVSEMFFHYDRKRDVFLLKKGSKNATDILKKVSNKEPPDWEAEIVRNAEQELEKRKSKFRHEKTVLNSRPEIIEDLTKRVRQFDGTGIYHVNVRSEGQEAYFHITYVNYHLSVKVLTLNKSAEKLSATVRGSWEESPEPPNLPIRFRMPDSVLQTLENKLTEDDYKYSLNTSSWPQHVGGGILQAGTKYSS